MNTSTKEAVDYIKSLSKNELIDYLYKWDNLANNQNEKEIKSWSKQQLVRCILTDIRLSK